MFGETLELARKERSDSIRKIFWNQSQETGQIFLLSAISYLHVSTPWQ